MKSEAPGLIEPRCLYLASEARSRLKIGDWAWRQMRRSGLRTIRQGNRVYVLGDDLLDFFSRQREGGGE